MATQAKPQAKPQPAAKHVSSPSGPAGREVAVKQDFAVTNARPSFLKDSGRGSENVTHADLVIPRLEVVQALSPARDKRHADYIEGAEEGMLYNSVTRELYGESVTVIPAFFLKEWLIWKDRKKGGGFRGAFASKIEAEQAIKNLKDGDGKPENPDDFEALDTAQHFCLLVTPQGKPQQIVLSMSKSKMKVSRKWNSLIALSGDDSFAKAYRVDSVQETNQNNQDYFNIKLTALGYVSESLYIEAEKLYTMLKSGGATADRSYSEDDVPAAGKADTGEF